MTGFRHAVALTEGVRLPTCIGPRPVPADTTWTLVAEQFEVVERVSTDPATGRQIITYSYRYEDILVATGEANNALLGTTQSAQVASHHRGPRMVLELHLHPPSWRDHPAFNDHPDNGTLDGDARSLVGLRKVSIRRVDVARSGVQNRTEVDFMGEDGPNFRPELFLELGSRGVVLFGQYKRTYRLGILDFEIPATFWRPTRRTFAIPFTNCGPATLFERHGHDPHSTRY